MKAFLAILCCLVLGIPLVFLTVLTRPQREAILTDIRSQWLRRVEPNAAVQTFPIAATNTVSGLLETVPVTFRLGGANGIVERLDGQRFVSVPFRGETGRGDRRLEIIRRLRAIQLPEIVTERMTRGWNGLSAHTLLGSP